MKEFSVLEPDFEGFDGIYVGSKNLNEKIPQNSFDLQKVKNFLRKGNDFSKLSQDEINEFKLAR